MSNDFLDRFTKIHRLPDTFKKALRYVHRGVPHTREPLEPNQATIEQTRNRIPKPKMNWRETQEWLKNRKDQSNGC